jgi:predicted RecA/RadA family phage recombinase
MVMKNYIEPGNVVSLLAPAGGCKSGDLVVVEAIVGVAAYDAAAGVEVELSLVGVYSLPAIGPIDQGAAVYFDTATKKVTAANSGTTLIGVALLAVGAGETSCRVRLNGTAAVAA